MDEAKLKERWPECPWRLIEGPCFLRKWKVHIKIKFKWWSIKTSLEVYQWHCLFSCSSENWINTDCSEMFSEQFSDPLLLVKNHQHCLPYCWTLQRISQIRNLAAEARNVIYRIIHCILLLWDCAVLHCARHQGIKTVCRLGSYSHEVHSQLLEAQGNIFSVAYFFSLFP